jgi:methylated-DNA-protein-cysteine methyltransferase-like protein
MNKDFKDKQEKIFSAIRAIPVGAVASYGQIASVAGLPRGHRLVARALRSNPENSDLPWYRVICADGRCGMPEGSEGYIKQFTLLKAEGILSKNGKVNMKQYQWQPGLDTFLFRPQDL